MNAAERLQKRKKLINEMQANAQKDVDCSRCVGTCCTFVANSMEITMGEAQDIFNALVANNFDLKEVTARMVQTIEQYRLESGAPGNGRRTYLRRTYTCPFFAGKSLGCTIPPESKPFGCLNFNPKIAHQTEGGDCGLSFPGFSDPDAVTQPIPIAIKNLIESTSRP